MNIKQASEKIAQTNPVISATAAAIVIRAFVAQLRDEMEATTSGSVAVPGLGQFRITEVTQGDQVTRRVMLVAPKVQPETTSAA
ncbi:MAG TPA: hypothetical protein VLA61_19570 [Ideonella sp.]|uniref:hypothetical protein n=1 Tax=Ideonella sp. TaxID=1929293 RepID=UPI002C9532EC|nr:hypothetical protein [Ideonella sp.]HSI50471.1 hypothetical protein [Ideonella sp.]